MIEKFFVFKQNELTLQPKFSKTKAKVGII